MGVPSDKVRITGIPIHPNFSKPLDTSYLRKHYNVKANKKIILLLGGSLGRGHFESIIDQMKTFLHIYELFVLVGKNQTFEILFYEINGCIDTRHIVTSVVAHS